MVKHGSAVVATEGLSVEAISHSEESHSPLLRTELLSGNHCVMTSPGGDIILAGVVSIGSQ